MAEVSDKIVSAAPVWTGQLASSIPDGTTTSFSLTSSSGLTNGEVYYFTIDRVDASGTKTPAKKEVIKGKVSGSNVIDCIRGVEGTAQAHASGATVEVLFTAAQWQALKEHITTEHNQNGTHDGTKVTLRSAFNTEHKSDNTHDDTKVAMLAGSQTFSGQKTFSGGIKVDTIGEATASAKTTFSNGIKTDTIDEKTSNSGVTVDGCLIKDGNAAKATVLSTSCKFFVYRESTQTIPSATDTKVQFNTEAFDVGNNYDSTTNYRFTAPVTGYYYIAANMAFYNVNAACVLVLIIYKNGSAFLVASQQLSSSDLANQPVGPFLSAVVYLAANDYLEAYAYQNSGSNANIWYTSRHSYFCGHLLST